MSIGSLAKLREEWIALNPVSCSLNGIPLLQGFDDPSYVGRQRRLSLLDRARNTLDLAAKDDISEPAVVRDETRLWIQRERRRLHKQSISNVVHLTALTAFALLPFVLAGRAGRPYHSALLEQRLADVTAALTGIASSSSFLVETQASALGMFGNSVRHSIADLTTAGAESLLVDLEKKLAAIANSTERNQAAPNRSFRYDVISVLDDLGADDISLAREGIKAVMLGVLDISAEFAHDPNNEMSSEPKSGSLQAWIGGVLNHISERLPPGFGCADATSIDVGIVPAIIQPFAPDGMFLRDWGEDGRAGPGLVLLPPAFENFEFRITSAARVAATIFILHEVFPGHAHHLRCSAHSSHADIFRVLKSPVTYEGWASHSESLIHLVTNDPGVADTIVFHRLRRLIPAYLLLENDVLSQRQTMSKLSSLPAHLCGPLKRFCQPALGAAMLPYALGMSEVQRTINRFGGSRCMDKETLSAINFLLAVGPVSPKSLRQFDTRLRS